MVTIREVAAEVESDGMQWVHVRTTGQTPSSTKSSRGSADPPS